MTVNFTALSLETISRLLGQMSVPVLDPSEMSLAATFRPLPAGFNNTVIRGFLGRLADLLRDRGVAVVPWKQALLQEEHHPGPYLRDDIQAVFDVDADRGIGDHVGHFVLDKLKVQIVSITDLNHDFADPNTPFRQKLKLGLTDLVELLSPIVIGVSEDRISIINMNLSDTVVSASELPQYIERGLLPKLAAPIRPIPWGSFVRGWYRPEQDRCASRLRDLASELAPTGLFPAGWQIRDLFGAAPREPLVVKLFEEITEGRTGLSYGFNALAAPPVYEGELTPGVEAWNDFYPVPGSRDDELRQGNRGRWFVRLRSEDADRVLQVPDVWVYSSRSGAPDKTKLDLERDIVRVGLVKGRMHCQIAEGLDFAEDIRPSFDTGVMLSIALAAALYGRELLREEMPIVHFHGYPDQSWFEIDEHFSGQENPEFACGTAEAAMLSFLEMAQLCSRGGMRLGCIVEPGHGSNLVARGIPLLLARLRGGCGLNGGERKVELGGRFFRSLLEQGRPTA
jgi:hypothetical protein